MAGSQPTHTLTVSAPQQAILEALQRQASCRQALAVFRQLFEAIVDRCRDDGLIWGKQLYADGTLVEADADHDKMRPRFAVEQHLQGLFGAVIPIPVDTAALAKRPVSSARADRSGMCSVAMRQYQQELV